jgi:hypothetical protein
MQESDLKTILPDLASQHTLILTQFTWIRCDLLLMGFPEPQ